MDDASINNVLWHRDKFKFEFSSKLFCHLVYTRHVNQKFDLINMSPTIFYHRFEIFLGIIFYLSIEILEKKKRNKIFLFLGGFKNN